MAELSVRKINATKLATKESHGNINVTAYSYFAYDPEDEGITILRNGGNYSPQNTASHPKTCIFNNTVVRTSKLATFK